MFLSYFDDTRSYIIDISCDLSTNIADIQFDQQFL